VVIVLVNLGVRYAAGVLSETFVTAALVAMLSGVLALGTWRARNVPGPWHGRRVFAWSMAGASLTAFLFSTTLALIVDRATAFVAPRMWFFIVMSAVPAIALLLPVFAGATLVGGLARAIPSRPMVKLGRAAAGCLLSGIVLVTATNTATLLGAWTRTESLVVGWGGLLLLLTGVAGVCTVTILLHRAAGRVLVDAVEAEAEAKLNAAAGRPTGVADAAG
jgi:peptidoglycan/LPS O-acetylase OafA/YrhL